MLTMRRPWTKRPRLFFVSLALLVPLLGGCGGNDNHGAGSPAQATQIDPQGLVRYAAPEGWTEERSPSRVRYLPGGSSKDPSVIVLKAQPRSEVFTPVEYMEQAEGKHEQQGHVKLSQTQSTRGEFEIHEAVYTRDSSDGSPIYHQVALFSEDLQIEVYLNAAGEMYEQHLPQLRRVVDSVVPAGAGS
jgi:hypothetical protein